MQNLRAKLWKKVGIALLLSWGIAGAELPPLLDRELFFGNPEIAGAQLSPDGQFIAFLKPWKDTRNIWVKRTNEPFSSARLLTAETKRPIPAFFWSRDSRFILFVKDNDGDENFNVWAVSPQLPTPPGEPAPQARNLTDLKGVRAVIYEVPKAFPDLIFVGLNDRDPAWHDLYQLSISTGERQLLFTNTERIAGWEFDLQGNPRLATRVKDDGTTEFLRFSQGQFQPIYSCAPLESCAVIRFHKNGQQVYILANRGDAEDLVSLRLLDLATGEETKVEADPEGKVDLTQAIFSERTDELVGTVYLEDRARVYFRDPQWAAAYSFLKKKFKDQEVSFSSMTADEQLMLVTVSADKEPGATYLFHRAKRKLVFQYRIRERLSRQYLASMRPVRYPSSDGLEIPAYLTLPKGVKAEKLPTIVVPHGGPWARDFWGYVGLAQFLANRGYAVLQPNFRGSTGYGKAFLNAGNRQWGEKMQDDLTWGVRYLVEKGIADPKRVGILGGSYGGYATLAGVAFTPDLYAAAVDIVGPSNLLTLLASIPPYWEAIRAIFHVRMGDPSTPEGKAQLERQSPLHHVKKIKTPLLIVQGANDPRVKKSESDQIVVALREAGFPVEYLLADDEGHGFARPVNQMAMYAAVEKFLAKHLGGRYQADMPETVRKRLDELTVDVTKVEKPKPITVSAQTLPNLTLIPGRWRYRLEWHAQGKITNLESEIAVSEQPQGWRVTETLRLPQGSISDTVQLAKDSLTLISRDTQQGPLQIHVAVRNGKVDGTVFFSGQSKPFTLEAPGSFFGEGPALLPAVASLPLQPGFHHNFYRLDVISQTALPCALTVAGEEALARGTDALPVWKVEVTCGDGQEQLTIWVDKDSRQVLKGTGTGARLGGASFVIELVSQQ